MECNSMKPWVTIGIKKSITKRDKIHKKMLREKNTIKKQIIWEHYKHYRNTITSLLQQSKINHYQKFFQENKTNCK